MFNRNLDSNRACCDNSPHMFHLRIAFAISLVAAMANGETITGRVTVAGGPSGGTVEVTNILASGCGTNVATTVFANRDGTFTFDGPPSIYALKARFGGSTINPEFRRVDTRNGSVSGVNIELRAGRWTIGTAPPPIASRITVSEPDANDKSTVRGSAGAVPASALVVLITLETGHHAATIADATGAFEATLFAPRGSHISVKIDEVGYEWRNLRAGPPCMTSLPALPGTIVRAAAPTPRPGVAFEVASAHDLPLWQLSGTMSKQQYQRGENVDVEATITVHAKSIATTSPLHILLHTNLEAIYVPGTLGARGNTLLSSHLMTPTGFPIERGRPGNPHDVRSEFDLTRVADDRATASFTLRVPIPTDLPEGYYRLVTVAEQRIPRTPGEHPVVQVDSKRKRGVRLPMFRVGSPPPPRVPLSLLMDHLSNGTQGIRAREDQLRFGIASRIATQSDRFVVPRVHPISGDVLTYRLEPFLPSVSMSDRDPPEIPLIPLRLPSGALRVTLTRPDGSVDTIGPAPLLQAWPATIVNRHGWLFDGGGGQITEAYRLTTLDPRFEVVFTNDGVHIVRAELSVDDEMGNRWTGEGTFEITVATPLVLDTTILPGTSFEVGDTLAVAGEILPPRAADVEAIFTLGLRTVTLRGRANAFGRFRLDPIELTEAGEYRIDIVATHRAASGATSAGARTWGSVVAPRGVSIVANGARGTDGLPFNAPRPQWFFHSQLKDVGVDHVPFPFLAGDVSWVRRGHSSIPALTYHDLTGSIVALLRPRFPNPSWLDTMAAEGEIQFFSSRPDGRDVHLDPSRIDVWAYAYASVQRPLVRVREEIGELQLQGGYWRFGEQYAAQMGAGASGDHRNDFKFQFGGGVVRGSAIATPHYAIYGSLWVMVNDDDPLGTRTFPPFQGNGGGPSGGPLFTLKGKEIDLFFHPTGVRPGSVLERGETVTFAGYVAPLLATNVEATITSPSETSRKINGITNKIGWFYDTSADFAANEVGVWRVKVKATFDGRTSAGPVSPPYPTGDVLGSREGEFFFYVIDPSSQELGITGVPRFVEAGQQPIAFTLAPPVPLTNPTLCHTATMPGFILHEGCDSSMTWTYDARALANDFPNLDLGDIDGSGGADAVTISFFVSGIDASGMQRQYARRVLVTAGEVHMPAQKTGPRRRGARR